MASRDEAGAAAATPEPLPLARILIEEGLVTAEQLAHAERVRTKLRSDRSLLEVVKEIHGLDDLALQAVLARRRHDVRLGDLLVELGYLRPEYLETALAIQREDPASKLRIGEVLVAHHFIEESRLVEVLAMHLGFPLETPDLAEPPADLAEPLPLQACEQHAFVPMRREGERVVVAFADPTNPSALEAAEAVFGAGRVVPAIASRGAIQTALRRLAGPERASTVAVEGAPGSLVAEIVDGILRAALEQRASAIHCEPREDRVAVRLRVEGVLVPHRDLPRTVAPAIATRLERLGGVGASERGRHRDGRARCEVDGRALDLHVSVYVTEHGERIVLRLRDPEPRRLALDELGLAPRTLERLRDDALERPSGLLLVAGPAGAGRATTLSACVETLRSDSLAILTADVPQAAANARASEPDLEAALHALAGQDPDVIVFGELRERRAAAAAVEAALAGRRVLATVTAEDAAAALLRLCAVGIEPGALAAATTGVLAQRLLRRGCAACAQPRPPTPQDLLRLGCPPSALEGAAFQAGRGCPACAHTGHRGRVLASELLVPDAAVRDALLAGAPAHALRRLARENAASLFEDALARAARGETTLREVIRVAPRFDAPRPLAAIAGLLGG